MALTREDTIAAIDLSLLDCASIFGDPGQSDRADAIGRQLDTALTELDRVKPAVFGATLMITAGTADYAAPADALGFVGANWIDGNAARDPWSPYALSVVPMPALIRVGNVLTWRFSPVPDDRAIASLGAGYAYTYRAAHRMTADAAECTFHSGLLPLVILRAQAAAMGEVAMRNTTKPVQMRDGLYSQVRNGTPAALADQLLKMWEQMTRDSSQLYGVWQ